MNELECNNVFGKVADEWYMELSTKYQVEKLEPKNLIAEIQERLRELAGQKHSAVYIHHPPLHEDEHPYRAPAQGTH